MKIIALKQKQLETNSKAIDEFQNMNQLVHELNKVELPNDVVEWINNEIELVNQISDSGKKLISQIKKHKRKIVSHVEKKTKFVPIKHYTNLWTLLGMTIFGLPFGTSLSIALNNFAFIGIGLPIGMVLGMALGKNMDQKALESGKQLNVEIKL